MDAVIVSEVTKTYNKGATVAVNNVSFSAAQGELFGLIGPDGAGKSSLFRILTTLLLPDNGTASVDGFDVVTGYKQIRSRVGYMPGKFSLYQDLTVEENLLFFANLFGTTIRQNYDLIKDIYIQIEPFKTRKAGKLSGGMKQKLALCCALIHKPSVLFLDEPTTGVDPVSRREFWDMLKKLKAQGITILVSTPYMDEAERCDRIALIQTGQILAISTPTELMASYPDNLYAISAEHMPKLLADARGYENTLRCFAFGDTLHISLRNDEARDRAALVHYLESQGNQGVSITTATPTIEDCFIRLLNH